LSCSLVSRAGCSGGREDSARHTTSLR
jgi:hypothetical protein